MTIEDSDNRINDLLSLLAQCADSPSKQLAREHLECARVYLLGAMNAEYSMSLDLIRKAVSGIPEDPARKDARRILDDLMNTEA